MITGLPTLLFAGCSFAAGGFVYSESQFRQTAAQTSASLMTLSCITLVIPAACKTISKFQKDGAYSLLFSAQITAPTSDEMPKTELTLNWLSCSAPKTQSMPRTPKMILSRVSSSLVEVPASSFSPSTSSTSTSKYVAQIISHPQTLIPSRYQLKSHSKLFEAEQAARQDGDDDEDEQEVEEMDTWSAGFWLAAVTVVTAFCADVLVASIDETASKWHIPKP
jgi:Ca2+:H+ antiporter